MEMKSPFYNIPEEMVTYLLCYLPAEDLLHHCCLVCHDWRNIIQDLRFWRRKCEWDAVMLPSAALQSQMINSKHPLDYKRIYFKNPFGRNLLKNWNAEDGLAGWHVTKNLGHHFVVESEVPSGANSLSEVTSEDCCKCWATSYGWCKKEQMLDLVQEGCSSAVLDHLQPEIHVSDWTAARWDCASEFKLSVMLLTEEEAPNKQTTDENRKFSCYHAEEQWTGRTWTQFRHVFRNYGPGVRYVFFRHGGKDRQFWAGHFGSKIAAPSVRIKFNPNIKQCV